MALLLVPEGNQPPLESEVQALTSCGHLNSLAKVSELPVHSWPFAVASSATSGTHNQS